MEENENLNPFVVTKIRGTGSYMAALEVITRCVWTYRPRWTLAPSAGTAGSCGPSRTGTPLSSRSWIHSLAWQVPKISETKPEKARSGWLPWQACVNTCYKAQLSDETLVYYYPVVIMTLSLWLLQRVKRHVSITGVPGKYQGQEPNRNPPFHLTLLMSVLRGTTPRRRHEFVVWEFLPWTGWATEIENHNRSSCSGNSLKT